jgi:hypothetical protein
MAFTSLIRWLGVSGIGRIGESDVGQYSKKMEIGE